MKVICWLCGNASLDENNNPNLRHMMTSTTKGMDMRCGMNSVQNKLKFRLYKYMDDDMRHE